MIGYLISFCIISAIVGFVIWINRLPKPPVGDERERDAFIQRW